VKNNNSFKPDFVKPASTPEEKKLGNYDLNDSANEILNVKKDSNS
jgi:hypothetical protein